MSIKVRIKNLSNNPNPEYKTINSSGMDVMAYLDSPITLKPLERAVIPTGLYIELPEGYEAQIRPRSGLCANYGLTVLNTPGTIDADYRGEIKIILINLSDKEVTIKNGDRICQMVITKVEKVEWINADELTKTTRGEGGFGHTGINN